jgi:hypothetical protein
MVSSIVAAAGDATGLPRRLFRKLTLAGLFHFDKANGA